MTKVFISYRRQDREFAQWIKDALIPAGIDARLDVWEPSPAENVASAIRDEIQAADALVAIFSEAPNLGHIGLEIGMAVSLGKKVVAVPAPGSKPDPGLLGSIADAYVLDAANRKPAELGAAIRTAVQGEHTENETPV